MAGEPQKDGGGDVAVLDALPGATYQGNPDDIILMGGHQEDDTAPARGATTQRKGVKFRRVARRTKASAKTSQPRCTKTNSPEERYQLVLTGGQLNPRHLPGIAIYDNTEYTAEDTWMTKFLYDKKVRLTIDDYPWWIRYDGYDRYYPCGNQGKSLHTYYFFVNPILIWLSTFFILPRCQ